MRYGLLIRNAFRLLFGNGFAVVAAFISTVLTVRGLGAELYGMLVFIPAFIGLVGQFLTFNAWQALITFGSRALHDKDEDAFVKIVRKACGLDLISGVVACAVGVLLSGLIVDYLGWDSSIAPMLRFYSLTLICRVDGAFAGILRLLGRFNALAGFSVFSASIRLAGVATAFVTKSSIESYLTAYMISVFAGQIYLLAAVAKALGLQRMKKCLQRGSSTLPEFKGFYAYVWTTNLHSSVKLITRELDQIIVAAILTPAAVGILKISREFGRILHMIADPLYHSLFPELSRLWAEENRDEFIKLTRKISKTAAIFGVAGIFFFLLAGRQVIELAFGQAFLTAFPAAVIFMLASLVALISLPLQPAMLAVGQPEASFTVNLVAASVYLVVLIPFTRAWAINGAAAAYVVYYIIWAALMRGRLKRTLVKS